MENEIRIEDGVMYVNNRPFDPVKGIFVDPAYAMVLTIADEMLNQKIGFLNERVSKLEDRLTRLAVLLEHLSTATAALAEQTVRHLTPPKVEEEKVKEEKTEYRRTVIFGVPIFFDPTYEMYWGPNGSWICRWQPKEQTFLYSSDTLGVDVESEVGLANRTLKRLVDDFNAGKYKTLVPIEGTTHTTVVRMRHIGGNWMTERR